jgi:hypothetical protein
MIVALTQIAVKEYSFTQLRKIGFLIVQEKKTDFLLFRNYELQKITISSYQC